MDEDHRVDQKHNEKISDSSGSKLRNDLQLEALMAASYSVGCEPRLHSSNGGANPALERPTRISDVKHD